MEMQVNATEIDERNLLQLDALLSHGYGLSPQLVMRSKGLSIEAKALYGYLSSFAGAGDTAFPSTSRILEELDISKNRFYKIRKELVSWGFISIETTATSAGLRTVYTLPQNPIAIKTEIAEIANRRNEIKSSLVANLHNEDMVSHKRDSESERLQQSAGNEPCRQSEAKAQNRGSNLKPCLQSEDEGCLQSGDKLYRDHPFIVYSYGDEACFHDDVEFDSLRTAISYASQLHSGAIDPDYLRVEYTHDEYETLCWRDFYQAAHGNIEYASRLVDQCNGGFREGFGPYACAAEDLAEGEIVNFNNCYVITDANGPDTKEIAAKRIWDELGDVCIDDNECIDSEFYGYPIGTFREDIWHDIEDQLGVPIHELMFPDDVNKDMTNERSLTMSNENKNTNVKEETTWTNFKFFNNQVKLKVIEKDDRQMYLADCRFMPGSVANGIDLGDQNGISGHMTVFLTEKQYFKAAEQKANGEQINVGLPSTQLKDGKIEVNFYNHESKEAHTIQVNPFAASKANKAAREAFFERKDAEREQGKSLGAKAASARGASEKLDGQSQAAPAKDNLEH